VKARGGARIDETAIFDTAEGECTMSSAEATELTDVLNRVRSSPETLRITLAHKILESLDKAERPSAPPPSKTRGFSAAEVHALLKTDRPGPNDETVKLSETIESHPISAPPGKGSLKDLLGILTTDSVPPNDEECRAILEEELIKKHLK
jgi:hypothetical protein